MILYLLIINFKRHIYNFFFKNFTHIERFKFAKNLLYNYARAKLVIIIRILAALPCLALNTPVILVNKNFNKRFPELYELLDTIGINQKRKSEIRVNVDSNGYVYNFKEYLKYSIRLKEALKNI